MQQRLGRIVVLGVAILLGVATARDFLDQWVARTDLPPLTIETSVEVLARDGSLLRAFTVADGRWRLQPGIVDPMFVNMLIAYEDKRFYRHSGVDLLAMTRAAIHSLRQGRIASGASTLTMQVARLLEASGTGKLKGKLRQIRVALALERRLSKDEILEIYLRIAPYGGNVEGLRAATLTYFGKEPWRLTPAQSALLVALPQSPETRRPERFAAVAQTARNRVLARMVTAGMLDADRARAARSEPVPATRKNFPTLAPHLAERLVAADPLKIKHYTTIDATLQASLERLASKAVSGADDRVSVAMVVANHQTGEIVATVGAPDWTSDRRAGFVDMTRAIRSPGSALKPFVYGLAFDAGLAHPETLIEDRPIAFGTYTPQNFDKIFRGTIPIRQALQLSLNIPVVSLTEALGPARLISALARAGVKTEFPVGQPGLAIALGGVGVSLEGLVQGYAALARLGAPIDLTVTHAMGEPLSQRLFSPEAAWMVGDILAGLPPPANAPGNRLAYKTGTSYGHRDAWAVGYDGQHVAGVWMGRADGAPVPGAFGGDHAAPILFDIFGRLKSRPDPLPPPPPATLILANAQLPRPLRQFRSRDAVFVGDGHGPEVAFPPNGAQVALDGLLTVKVRGGTPPFTWLANGAPAVIATRTRETALARPEQGYLTLSVIDATGRSATSTVILIP